jgi:microcystin-dependent protein
MDVTLGTILAWPISWAPVGWHMCDGTILPVAQNTALFSLIGSIYGGDGRTTFALPDLRCRIPLTMNNGTALQDLTTRELGTAIGTEKMVSEIASMPAHTHIATITPTSRGGKLLVSEASSNTKTPNGNYYANATDTSGSGTPLENYSTEPGTLGNVAGLSVTGRWTVTNAITGDGQGASIMPPFFVLNFIIATSGYYPIRN